MRTGDNARHVARRPPRAGELGLVGGEDLVPFALRWRPKALADAGPLRALWSQQLGRPRIALQRIRTNAQAPWARWLEAAPVPPSLVCLDSLSTLSMPDGRAPGELLWALLALVSSVALQRYHRLRTTDVNVKPSALRELPVPRALLAAPGELAALARERAALEGMSDPLAILTPGGGEGPLLYKDRARARSTDPAAHALDRRIDARVYALFGLRESEVDASERGFWAERFSEEIQRLKRHMSDPPRSLAREEETA
jgi:hypothetical protein